MTRQKGFPYYKFEGYNLDRDRFETIRKRLKQLITRPPFEEKAFFKTLVNAYLMGVKDAVELIGEKYSITLRRDQQGELILGDCTCCDYWRGRMNPKTGTLIPKPDKSGWASSKCTRPGGHCSPFKVK